MRLNARNEVKRRRRGGRNWLNAALAGTLQAAAANWMAGQL